MRPINELRMAARWKLGGALAQAERAKHPGKGKVASASLTSLLTRITLDRQTAMEAQRIGTMPDDELVTFAILDVIFPAARRGWRGRGAFV